MVAAGVGGNLGVKFYKKMNIFFFFYQTSLTILGGFAILFIAASTELVGLGMTGRAVCTGDKGGRSGEVTGIEGVLLCFVLTESERGGDVSGRGGGDVNGREGGDVGRLVKSELGRVLTGTGGAFSSVFTVGGRVREGR